MPARRVAFYVEQVFHTPILGPIRDALVKSGVETLFVDDRAAVVRFAPHLILQASFADLAYFRRSLPATLIGSVGHGLATKGTPRRIAARSDPAARRFDFVCVGDESKVARYVDAGVEPDEFWHTGYPQLDPLFRGDAAPSLGLDQSRSTVLFAPTWNPGLTAANFVGPRLDELIRGDGPRHNIVIKPHPHIARRRPRWMSWWRSLAERDPGVRLVAADEDITPYMLAADVLVSDASSVIFQFLALDRPIVLVTNPMHRWDPAFDPDDICWRWRDVGEEVTRRQDLAGAIARALADPTAGAERRRHYSDKLFGTRRDGRNAERVAEHIIAAIERLPDEVPVAMAPRTGASSGVRRSRGITRRVVRSDRFMRHAKGSLEDARLWLRSVRKQTNRS